MTRFDISRFIPGLLDLFFFILGPFLVYFFLVCLIHELRGYPLLKALHDLKMFFF